MVEKNIEKMVQSAFMKVFPDLSASDFDFNKTQEQFENWDSFSHMELVSNIEKESGIDLDMEEVIAIRTPTDFVTAVKRKQKT